MRHNKELIPHHVVNSDSASRRTRSNHRCHLPGTAGGGSGSGKTLVNAVYNGTDTLALTPHIVSGTEEVYLNGIRLFGDDYILVATGGKAGSVIILDIDEYDQVRILGTTREADQNPDIPVDKYRTAAIPDNEIWYTNSRNTNAPDRAFTELNKASGVRDVNNEVLELHAAIYEKEHGLFKFSGPIRRLDGAVFHGMMLASVRLHKGIDFVGNSCFENCSMLEEAILDCSGRLTFGYGAFRRCSRLHKVILLAEEVEIPNTGVFDGTHPELVIHVRPDRLDYMKANVVLRNYRVEPIEQ